MTSTTHQPESTVAALYVALELSTKEWWLTMSVGPNVKRHRVRVAVGDRGGLARALAAAKARFGLWVDAPVRGCYEAGREGFWPHRLLTALGVTNLVVDSSSIEVSRRLRHAKTDRLDGAKLLRLLMRHWGGERDMWHVVSVPSCEVEDARHASRARTTLQIERTRYRNRIHALLALHGVRLRLDRGLPERLATATDWAGMPLPAGIQARVLQLWRLLYAVETERHRARYAEDRQVHATTATPTCAQRLVRLRGVAARGATVLADELFRRDLRNRRQVGALTGLVSAPYDSGTRSRDQGLTRAGLPRVRHIAVQLAWAWLRYQRTSALSQWYQRKFGGRGVVAQRIGIVALARRLVIALWRYVKDGIVPEGAQLKAA
jgi:transposase